MPFPEFHQCTYFGENLESNLHLCNELSKLFEDIDNKRITGWCTLEIETALKMHQRNGLNFYYQLPILAKSATINELPQIFSIVQLQLLQITSCLTNLKTISQAKTDILKTKRRIPENIATFYQCNYNFRVYLEKGACPRVMSQVGSNLVRTVRGIPTRTSLAILWKEDACHFQLPVTSGIQWFGGFTAPLCQYRTAGSITLRQAKS